MIEKKYLGILAATAIIGGSILAVNQVRAMGYGQNGSMIQMLAEKLGKSEAEVQTALDAVHQERITNGQLDYESELTKAVSAGKLSEEQKQLLLRKRQEIQQEREDQRGLMMARHDELEQWAQDNGIAPEYLYGMGRREDRGPRGTNGGYGEKMRANFQQ